MSSLTTRLGLRLLLAVLMLFASGSYAQVKTAVAPGQAVEGALELKVNRTLASDLVTRVPLPPGKWTMRLSEEIMSTGGPAQFKGLALYLDQSMDGRISALVFMSVYPNAGREWSAGTRCTGELMNRLRGASVDGYCYSLRTSAFMSNATNRMQQKVREAWMSAGLGRPDFALMLDGFFEKRGGVTLYMDYLVTTEAIGIDNDRLQQAGARDEFTKRWHAGVQSGVLSEVSRWIEEYTADLAQVVLEGAPPARQERTSIVALLKSAAAMDNPGPSAPLVAQASRPPASTSETTSTPPAAASVQRDEEASKRKARAEREAEAERQSEAQRTAEARRVAEEARLAQERRDREEQLRLAEARRVAEQERARQEAAARERERAEQLARERERVEQLAREQRAREEAARQAEASRQAEEAARQRRIAAEQQETERRLAEQKRREEEALLGKRIALVIGNSRYERRPLANPVNDADDMSTALKASGFKVIDVRNANLTQMRRAVREFGDQLLTHDVGLVYYAGHGVEVKGRNYFIPVTADIQREDEIADQSLDVSLILEKMTTAKKGVNLLIVDACRDDPFGRSFRSAASGLASMEAPKGTIIAYATSPGKVAADGDGRNSPYTKHLIRAMQEPNRPVELVFKDVRRAVQSETQDRQTPWENTSLSGDFYFRVKR